MPSTHLLTDSNVAAFVRTGFHIALPAPDEPHGETADVILELFERAGNPDNDIYNLVPGLRKLIARNEVRGILTSLLGPEYRLQCHCHCHLLPAAESDAARLPTPRHHQDGTPRQFKGWNRPWRRWHRPRKLNVFYYPRDVSLDHGPTQVVSGSQYWSAPPPNADAHTETLDAPSGTLVFTHYNLWHRGTVNLSDEPRIMVKFVFERCAEPEAPSWNAEDGFDFEAQVDGTNSTGCPGPHSPRLVWHWLCAEPDDTSVPTADADALWHLARAQPETADSIEGTYELARHGERAVDTVAAAFSDPADPVTRERAALVLSNGGRNAVPLLSKSLSSEDEWIRATALDLLADVGLASLEAVSVAAAHIDDPSAWVRHNLMQTLEVWGPRAEDQEEVALRGLDDEIPHVCFNAMSALVNMGADDELVRKRLKPLRAHPHPHVSWKASQLLAPQS